MCFLSIEDIEKQLDIKNGIYIPATNFGGFMYEMKEGNCCIYGLKVSKFKKISKSWAVLEWLYRVKI